MEYAQQLTPANVMYVNQPANAEQMSLRNELEDTWNKIGALCGRLELLDAAISGPKPVAIDSKQPQPPEERPSAARVAERIGMIVSRCHQIVDGLQSAIG